MPGGGKTVNLTAIDFINFPDFFKVSVGGLLMVDLMKLGELKLKELLANNDVYMTNSKIRVLVGRKNNVATLF